MWLIKCILNWVEQVNSKLPDVEASHLFKELFSSNRPTGPIRSSSRDVRLSVCVFVPFPCDFFKVLKSKVFIYVMWLYVNINK